MSQPAAKKCAAAVQGRQDAEAMPLGRLQGLSGNDQLSRDQRLPHLIKKPLNPLLAQFVSEGCHHRCESGHVDPEVWQSVIPIDIEHRKQLEHTTSRGFRTARLVLSKLRQFGRLADLIARAIKCQELMIEPRSWLR